MADMVDGADRGKHAIDSDMPATGIMESESPVARPYNPKMETREILVENQHVGRIIGRGGQTIRNIQHRSGASLAVPQESEPGENHRKITIHGTPEQVQYCHVLVKLQLPSTDEEKILQLQNEMQELSMKDEKLLLIKNIEVPMELVGRIIGRGGMYIRVMQDQTGATITLPRFSIPGSKNQIFTITGNEKEVASCRELLQQKITECNDPNVRSPGHTPRSMPLRHGFTSNDIPCAHINGVLYIRVPDQLIGKIIGKQGAAVKEFQRQTGTRINLPKGPSNSLNFRELEVRGTLEQRNSCLNLLTNTIPQLRGNVVNYDEISLSLPPIQSTNHMRVPTNYIPHYNGYQAVGTEFGAGMSMPMGSFGSDPMVVMPGMQYQQQWMPVPMQMYNQAMMMQPALPYHYTTPLSNGILPDALGQASPVQVLGP